MTSQGKSRGFTLIEVLVALAVLALTFGMAYQTLSTGLDWSDRSRTTQEATMIAAATLERVGHDIALADGEQNGRTDGFDWRVAATPYQSGNAFSAAVTALRVEVVVNWLERHRSREFRLVTVRLAYQERAGEP